MGCFGCLDLVILNFILVPLGRPSTVQTKTDSEGLRWNVVGGGVLSSFREALKASRNLCPKKLVNSGCGAGRWKMLRAGGVLLKPSVPNGVFLVSLQNEGLRKGTPQKIRKQHAPNGTFAQLLPSEPPKLRAFRLQAPFGYGRVASFRSPLKGRHPIWSHLGILACLSY